MPALALLVPCRLQSTRFPQKLLHRVRGRPLVLWVAHRLAQEVPEIPATFAVDDERLAAPLRAEGFATVLTSAAHQSGTDRLAEANRRVRADCIVNVQADEPLVTRAQILALARRVQAGAPMATLATPFRRAVDFANPNQVKVVLGADGCALYFSRAPIPYPRDLHGAASDEWVSTHPVHKHLGLYAYQATFLEQFTRLPPGRLEQIEKLEQLRALEHGHRIAVDLTDDPGLGVDTLADAERFEAALTDRAGE
jgi:3-deoxy-manno-octulosonate cytidylyltransferase (CMP-KDO synthetase)